MIQASLRSSGKNCQNYILTSSAKLILVESVHFNVCSGFVLITLFAILKRKPQTYLEDTDQKLSEALVEMIKWIKATCYLGIESCG